MKTKYEITNAKLHLAKGNNKIGKGIWAFATVPGNEVHKPTLATGEVLSNVTGTCSKYCDGCAKNGACYAWRDFMLHHNVCVEAWSENTLLLRSGKLFTELDKFITEANKKYLETGDKKYHKVATFRINTSGEIENLEQFNNWNELAKKHPEVTFGIYTKNYDVVKEFLKTNENTADNFVVNISQWHHVADDFLKENLGKFNVFEYDDSNKKDNNLTVDDIKRLANETHCPAVKADGHHAMTKDGKPITCDMCRRCYRKTGELTAVYAH